MDQSSVVQLERYNLAAALETVQEDVEGEEIGSFQHDDDGSIHEEEGEYRYGALMAVMDSKGKGDRKQIVVVYRYTEFTAASDRGTTVHRLRFVVPQAGDMARSLQLVGASLATLVYPGHIRADLQYYWSCLLTQIVPKLSPGATGVEVLFHAFGCTPEREESVRPLLKGAMDDMSWPGCECKCHSNMEFHLPVPCGAESAAAKEHCPVCLELLEGKDLASWLGCSKQHMFHGSCLELVLQVSDKCPLCRNLFYIEHKPLSIHKEEEEEEESHCEVDGHVTGESRRISEGEVDGQAAAASSAACKSKNVRQALLRTFLGLFLLVCIMLLFLRCMM
jgi:hypothetical protein